MKFEIAATVAVECAHQDNEGCTHGHSLLIEAWTGIVSDLEIWEQQLRQAAAAINKTVLEASVGGGRFEDVAVFIGKALPNASRVIIRLPSAGYIVELFW